MVSLTKHLNTRSVYIYTYIYEKVILMNEQKHCIKCGRLHNGQYYKCYTCYATEQYGKAEKTKYKASPKKQETLANKKLDLAQKIEISLLGLLIIFVCGFIIGAWML